MGGLRDPRHGPDFDLSGAPWTRTLILASTPRTGSTLLARLLWATGRAAAPREYLNPVALHDWTWRRSGRAGRAGLGVLPGRGLPVWAAGRAQDPRFRQAHLAAVVAARTDRSGLFAVKVHAHHARRWWGALRDRPGVIVRVSREDRVGQAVSWARARRTGRWAAHQRGNPRLDRPDAAAVDRRLAAIARDEAWWDQTLADRPVVRLSYEAVVADPEAAARAVLRALGDPDADRARIPPPASRSQADGRAALWRDVWRASRGEGTDLHRRIHGVP